MFTTGDQDQPIPMVAAIFKTRSSRVLKPKKQTRDFEVNINKYNNILYYSTFNIKNICEKKMFYYFVCVCVCLLGMCFSYLLRHISWI